MQVTRIVSSVAVIAAVFLFPNSLRAADPVEINVITSLTGQNALIGKQTADSLHIIESLVNQRGGIAGRPVKFVIADDQTNPQVSLQLANAIVAKRAAVMLGPASSAGCNAIAPLLQTGPVMWCFSPGFHPAKGSYAFSSNASSSAQIVDCVRYFHALGLNKLALLASTDATGQDGEHSLDAALALPEMLGVSIAVREHFNVTDMSVAAQMANIKSSGAQALIAWVTATPFGTVLRGFAEAGLDMPIATNNGNGSTTQMKSYAAFIPKTLLIPAMFNQVPDQIPPSPVKRKVDEFYQTYKTVLGFPPEGSANLSWDSAIIVIDALKKYGPNASAQQIRDYVEGLHGWVGVNGEYDFRDGSQRGLGDRNVVIVRWDPTKNAFIAVSKAGGIPLR